MMFSTEALARTSARHPWKVIAAWAIVLVTAIAVIGSMGIKTTTEIRFSNSPEAQTGFTVLADAGLDNDTPTDETVIVRSEGMTVDDDAFRERVEAIVADLRTMPDLVESASVASYYELAANPETAEVAAGMVSGDRHTLLIPLTLTGAQDVAAENAPRYKSELATHGGDGFEVSSVGFISIADESNHIAEEDLVRGETFGVLAALVILVVVFGALVAAGIPIMLALVSITISFGITALIGQVWDLSFFITNMITMIGLAVGIDYALFVVERYREERRHGRDPLDAIAVSGGTATKAVAFSGGTVVLALSGLFLLPATLFRALAAGAVIVVIISVVATSTLVPAVLGLLRDRIDWPRRRRTGRDRAADEPVYAGFWGRITRAVMTRPVIGLVVASTLLVAASIPYWDIETGFAGAEAMPADSEVRRSFEILNEEFSAGALAPLQIAVSGDRAELQDEIDALRTELGAMTIPGTDEPAFLPIPAASWALWNDDGSVAKLQATMTHASNDGRSYDTVNAVRDEVVPAVFGETDAAVYVTGESAFNQDFFDLVARYTPIIVGYVLALSFLLLLLAFRSIVVSAKAIVMNLLSVGAAYGLLVLVFQKGVGNELFGLQHTPTIEAWLPLFLFCVLFGLSMDYQVFLLSRIREHYDLTANNAESVAVGLKSTGRIITGAALIMVAVFAGFASGRLVMLQQMGFGLGVAILLDATIVRSVIVPSAMALLGDRNWYMPKWLAWLPDLRVEGAPRPAPVDALAPAPAPVSGGEHE